MDAKKFFNHLEGRLLNPNRDLSQLSAEEQYNMIMSKVGEFPDSIVSKENLLEKLRNSKKTGKPLKIKFGIDPTGSQIHLGHAVPLLNLRMFQNMGHDIVIVIGDFTATIGDPSGRNTEREPLTQEMVVKNMATYEKQAGKIIDFASSSISKRFNSEWMSKLTIPEWIKFQSSISITEVLQREDFKKRIEAGSGITMAELEYACYMGYDSVVLKQISDDAIEKIERIWSQVALKGFAGIMGIDRYEDGRCVGGMFPEDVTEMFLYEKLTTYRIPGDKKMVHRTDLLKKVAPTPIFPGEKFFNPSYMMYQLDQFGKLYVTNECFCIVDYQPDGMSSNFYKQLRNSPRSFAETRKLYLSFPDISPAFKLRHSIHYVSNCLTAKRLWQGIKESVFPGYTLLALLPGLALYLLILYKTRT